MVKAICLEIDQRHIYLGQKEISSIYFGGGTPSILSGSELSMLLEHIHKYFVPLPNAEITLEANPDDINNAGLLQWLQLGINRLSIGLQSFNDSELRWMNRAHNAAQSVASVKRAQDAGFSNITIDLIYGSKFQSMDDWARTLEQTIALNVPHISAYNLTIEKKTVLGHFHARGLEPAVDDHLSSAQFRYMVDFLHQQGFVQYEISNFARPGFIALHNSNYWKQQPYLGLGPSAHSFNLHSRQWNVRSNKAYISGLMNGRTYYEAEALSEKDRYNEYVLTRLRTIWGCDKDEILTLFGKDVLDHFNKRAQEKSSYLETEGHIMRLNASGKLLADGIASDFFIV